jgi:putative redox protein
MQIKITITDRDKDFGMEAKDALEHSLPIDTGAADGGHDSGFRPMQLLLVAAGGCANVDVLMILRKQKQQVDGYHITVTGEREPGKEPSLWKKVHLHFELKGAIDPAKAERAMELSMNKYCSVVETLRRAGAEITWEVAVIDS